MTTTWVLGGSGQNEQGVSRGGSFHRTKGLHGRRTTSSTNTATESRIKSETELHYDSTFVLFDPKSSLGSG
jgi:hypothetical protein